MRLARGLDLLVLLHQGKRTSHDRQQYLQKAQLPCDSAKQTSTAYYGNINDGPSLDRVKRLKLAVYR